MVRHRHMLPCTPLAQGDDSPRENQFRHSRHRRCHPVLNYLVVAGAVAGVAFLLSVFAVLLVVGFLASSLATTGAAGAVAVTAGLATSAAETEIAKKAITVAIMISFWFPLGYVGFCHLHIYNAIAQKSVDYRLVCFTRSVVVCEQCMELDLNVL